MKPSTLRSLILVWILVVAQMTALAASFTFDTVALMTDTTSSLTTGDTATVSGYYAVNDGGGGTFTYNSASTTTANGYSVFALTNTTGRWTRSWPSVTSTSFLHVKMFGAVGGRNQSSGTRTANTRAIQNAINETLSQGHPTLKFGGDFFELNRLTDGDASAASQDNPTGLTMVRPSGTPGASGQNRKYIYFSYLLQITDAAAAGKSLTLFGEGATLYTEEELYDPDILTVDASFTSLTIEGVNFDRKVTLTHYPRVDPGYYTGADYYGNTANGKNRKGVRILPVASQSNAAVTVKNVTFSECHPAIFIEDQTRADLVNFVAATKTAFRSKLTNFTVASCKFIYPHGGNAALEVAGHETAFGNPAYLEPIGLGGGVTIWFTSQFVKQATVTDCFFDGAVGGDLSHEPSEPVGGSDPSVLASAQLPMDGFLYGCGETIVYARNRIQHFDVEGNFFSDREYYTVVPAVSVTDSEFDGTPVIRNYVGGRPVLAYGIWGVRADAYHATISNNSMLNLNQPILVSEGIGSGSGTEAGSVIDHNFIRTNNSDELIYPENGTIQNNVMAIAVYGTGGVTITNNLINLPVSRSRDDTGYAINTGALVSASHCDVENNIIWADGYGTGKGRGIGIAVANGTTNNTVSNNVITNFENVVLGWPSAGLDGSDTVANNSSATTANVNNGPYTGYHPLTVPDAAVQNPAYGFEDDVNRDTGMFLEDQNTIGLAAGGVNRMTIGTQAVTTYPQDSVGSVKSSTYLLSGTSTGSTVLELTTDGGTAANANRIPVVDGKSYAVTVTWVGRAQSGGTSCGIVRMGTVKSVSGVTTVLTGTDSPSTQRDNTGWTTSLAVTDNSSGTDYFKITATGTNGSTINWAAKVELLEISQTP